jgi:predicted nucleotide-binding protein
MARVNSELFEKIQQKRGLSRSRVYGLIDEKVRSAHLPRHLAALAVAAESGVNISRFASEGDLATMRNSAISAAPAPVVVPVAPVARRSRNQSSRSRSNRTPRRGTTVFVVHGRDLAARDAVFSFLRSLGLRPLEWTQVLRLTRRGSPYVGEALDAAFAEAAAVVVLITPDDEARLRPSFLQASDPAHERNLTGQARPNVLFEAGMAFGRNANSTVLVQLGETRPFSDVGGRHVLRLANTPASRQEFATKLANAGCNVDTSGTDWLSAGNFVSTAARSARRRHRTRR